MSLQGSDIPWIILAEKKKNKTITAPTTQH